MLDEELMTLIKPKPWWLKSIVDIKHIANSKMFFVEGIAPPSFID